MTASAKPYVVTLGTAGGPDIWTSEHGRPRCGIATALVIGDAWYLVDAGYGCYSQIKRAGLSMQNLNAIFITHLHSDHIVDLNALLLFGLFGISEPVPSIPIIGPGDRGELPPVSPAAERPPEPVIPAAPTPGVAGLFDGLVRAHATDINDRVLDTLRPSPLDVFSPRDIALPTDIGYASNANPFPDMAPFVVFEDSRVRVTATLVIHPPIAPAFAFRFDVESGESLTISGDTRPSDNLVTLAENTDILLHEAMDFDWVSASHTEGSDTAQALLDHHHKSHTSPEDAGRIATRASARALALHHIVPGTAPARVWQQAENTFDRRLHIPDDNEIIRFSDGV